MTTYTYKCDSCGDEVEVKHGMSENPEILCENILDSGFCCNQPMRKKLGSPKTMFIGEWETRDVMETHSSRT